MSPKSILLSVSLILFGLAASAQYTEKINSNRPGTSQGAFSVGNNVLQFEGGIGLGKQKHDILNTKTNSFTLDYTARYGLLIEQLELRVNGRFRSDGVRFTVGGNEEKVTQTNFELNTIGAKYLIYDPYKNPKKDSINLNSWREQHKFKWKSLIPAVSAYLGVNFAGTDNPFTSPNDDAISPKIVIATQNNWSTSLNGDWVLVTNLIIDKVTTDDPILGWIITSTHTINDTWAIFGEYQGQKSDFYSDNLLRFGGAYLFNNDLQFDANIAFNFKDTPSIFNVSVGASYRFDWHTKDEIIEQPGLERGVKEDQLKDEEEGEGENEKEENEFDEFEEIENDSLKQERTPFINEFEDDSHREELEKDLDERRTAERIERERIEAEKIAKKEGKKFQKEERRRLKREEKEARKAEKERIKAEQEKQKMIDDIDAELDKIEQEQGVDTELDELDKELKKLEEEQNTDKELEELDNELKKLEEEEKKQAEEEKQIDEEYEKLQKEQEKAKKEEEKRKKKEEKKRLKEEKKRKKEEEKRKKQEEKKKGNDNENEESDNN
ncbi:transporter [Aquimarina sp. 2201CG5-10]|uniref:transporter n=1 Tax=Aquimarina callyspongiae TaxID=3098150 RepID=UPI002AB44C51|nr:transporter [Aquimarina sp. 2201CG5-10]MDY8135536.1 transporter [Aquimarina sp. 2201CG5-10]